MANKPERRPAGTALDVVSRLLGFVVLIAVGVGLLLFALELLSAAGGRHLGVWGAIPVPWSHGTHIALLAGAFLLLVVALAVETRRMTPALVFPCGTDGSLAVPAEALEELISMSLATHPDVLRARVAVRPEGDGVAVTAKAVLRPLADVPRLQPQLDELVRRGLGEGTGLALESLRLSARAIRVRQLVRYLHA